MFLARSCYDPPRAKRASREDFAALRGRQAIVDAVRRLHGRPNGRRAEATHVSLCELSPCDHLAMATSPAGDPVVRVALERVATGLRAPMLRAVALGMVHGARERAAAGEGVSSSRLCQRRTVGLRVLRAWVLARCRGGVHPLG